LILVDENQLENEMESNLDYNPNSYENKIIGKSATHLKTNFNG
jgi:hypothetical protein